MPSKITLFYTVTIDGNKIMITESLQDAIRNFDRVSCKGMTTGGIEVAGYSGGLMVRDGWILHVREGSVYLNPNLSEADIAS